MRIPKTLASLVEDGIIQDVLRPLMSGKEAQVYLVRAGGEQRVAKVYKEAHDRTFKHRATYTEGRRVRNSRDRRAMNKRSKHGKSRDEAAWRTTEVQMIYRLQQAGVRVPEPHHFIDGVLIMELIADAHGNPAPRLGDVTLEPEAATAVFERLLRDVVRMLCAGIVHGDLSDFNVLMGADGPVLIDFPQAVDPSSNHNARRLLIRDVDNLNQFLARSVPDRRPRLYAQEMWHLYQSNQLAPDTVLTGQFRPPRRKADTRAVIREIDDARRDARVRRDRRDRTDGARRDGNRPTRNRDAGAPTDPGRGNRQPRFERRGDRARGPERRNDNDRGNRPRDRKPRTADRSFERTSDPKLERRSRRRPERNTERNTERPERNTERPERNTKRPERNTKRPETPEPQASRKPRRDERPESRGPRRRRPTRTESRPDRQAPQTTSSEPPAGERDDNRPPTKRRRRRRRRRSPRDSTTPVSQR